VRFSSVGRRGHSDLSKRRRSRIELEFRILESGFGSRQRAGTLEFWKRLTTLADLAVAQKPQKEKTELFPAIGIVLPSES
jgi:hypothetical protein